MNAFAFIAILAIINIIKPPCFAKGDATANYTDVNIMFKKTVPVPDTIKQFSNLYTFCKTWGLLKYYNGKTKLNFNDVFTIYYPLFKNAPGKEEFNMVMSKMLDTLEVINPVNNNQPATKVVIENIMQRDNWKPISDTSMYTIRPDFNWIATDTLLSEYNKWRLVDFLSSYKPTAKSKYIGKSAITKFKEGFYSSPKLLPEDRDVLAVFTYWNIVNYFFPYKRLMDTNWDSTLADMLPMFINSPKQYWLNLNHLNSKLDDSHGAIWISSSISEKGKKKNKQSRNLLLTQPAKNERKDFIPFHYKIVNNYFLVDRILDSVLLKKGEIKVGDTIIRINYLRLKNLRNWFRNYFANSTSQSLDNNSEEIGPYYFLRSTTFNVVIQRGMDTTSYSIDGITMSQYKQRMKPTSPVYYSVNDSMGYLRLYDATRREGEKAFRKFRHYKAIIFDMRGYPEHFGLNFPRFLSRKPKAVANYEYADKKYPGAFKRNKKPETYYFENEFKLGLMLLGIATNTKIFPVFKKPYRGKVVILISPDAISAAETYCQILKTYAPNATFIGQPTTGANGDVTELILPNGYAGRFSSLYWHYANGKQLQRIGIIPDIVVNPTAESIRNGEDIIFKEAVKFLEKNSP